ncbi:MULTISPECIES: flavin reductase family protein [unclassified Chryseobacterium]|uniref:flavin reductase family protein n=1 Tax=unclassified Chryseobacterium TaxID=2593645 RepID=UPI003010232C
MHKICTPSILYFGTPVILISTVNENSSFNAAPISSIFWLGWRCVIGISAVSKTCENLLRTGECVINLPSEDQVGMVNKLALTTGSNPVPQGKKSKGYRHESRKFEIAGMTPVESTLVNSPRILECPVQMEARLIKINLLAEDNEIQRGNIIYAELKIVRVHMEESILMDGFPNRVDPDKWRPLIMSFQQFYGLGMKLHESTLAQIPEELYRTAEFNSIQESK